MEDTSRWRWRPQKLLALAVIISLVPLPVLAADGTRPTSATPDLRASVARAVATQMLKSTNDAPAARAEVRTAKPSPLFNARIGTAARDEQGAAPENRSGQFFKTGPGIAVLAVFAAGVGYALYSSQHDRVSSPGKQ